MDPLTRKRVLEEIEKSGSHIIMGQGNMKPVKPNNCVGEDGRTGPGGASLSATFKTQAPVDWV